MSDDKNPNKGAIETPTFKLEKRSDLHGLQSQKRKLDGIRKIQITHGKIICGTATMDKDTRGRQSEEYAHVGDHVTLPADQAHELVTLGVAKYLDQAPQTTP